MTDKTSEEKAFDQACAFLSYRPRTKTELARYLRKKGWIEQLDSVMERLERAGLVDDNAFATAWVTERASAKGFGRRRLESELFKLGVEREAIISALDNHYPADAEFERAAGLAAERWRRLSTVDPAAKGRQVFGYLVRRGFSSGAAREAIDSLIRAERD
jgi:regulatory protein